MGGFSIGNMDLELGTLFMEGVQQILAGLCVAGALAFALYQLYSRVRGSKGGCGKGCGGCKDKSTPEKSLLQITIVDKRDTTIPTL